MASDLQVKAKEAFVDDHYELAADLLTKAIAINPNSAELYADRAQANIKLGYYTGSLLSFPIPFCFEKLRLNDTFFVLCKFSFGSSWFLVYIVIGVCFGTGIVFNWVLCIGNPDSET